MRPSTFHVCVYWSCLWCGRLLLTATFLLSLIGFAWSPQANWPSWVISAQDVIHDNGGWLLPVLLALVAFCSSTRQWVGEPWLWKAISSILDEFQEAVFGGRATLDEETIDSHRVTLYKWSRFCLWPGNGCCFWWPWGRGNWPFSGWLVPLTRSGPLGHGRTVFLAKGGQCSEGVCGAAYFSQTGVIELRDLPDIQESCDDVSCKEYARNSFVSSDWVRRRLRSGKPFAKCFYAIRIEVRKKPWGVIMIDSRNPRMPQPQKAQHQFPLVAKTLAILLERA